MVWYVKKITVYFNRNMKANVMWAFLIIFIALLCLISYTQNLLSYTENYDGTSGVPNLPSTNSVPITATHQLEGGNYGLDELSGIYRGEEPDGDHEIRFVGASAVFAKPYRVHSTCGAATPTPSAAPLVGPTSAPSSGPTNAPPPATPAPTCQPWQTYTGGKCTPICQSASKPWWNSALSNASSTANCAPCPVGASLDPATNTCSVCDTTNQGNYPNVDMGYTPYNASTNKCKANCNLGYTANPANNLCTTCANPATTAGLERVQSLSGGGINHGGTSICTPTCKTGYDVADSNDIACNACSQDPQDGYPDSNFPNVRYYENTGSAASSKCTPVCYPGYKPDGNNTCSSCSGPVDDPAIVGVKSYDTSTSGRDKGKCLPKCMAGYLPDDHNTCAACVDATTLSKYPGNYPNVTSYTLQRDDDGNVAGCVANCNTGYAVIADKNNPKYNTCATCVSQDVVNNNQSLYPHVQSYSQDSTGKCVPKCVSTGGWVPDSNNTCTWCDTTKGFKQLPVSQGGVSSCVCDDTQGLVPKFDSNGNVTCVPKGCVNSYGSKQTTDSNGKLVSCNCLTKDDLAGAPYSSQFPGVNSFTWDNATTKNACVASSCKTGYKGTNCSECATGYTAGNNGTCVPAGCSGTGSYIDANNVCQCTDLTTVLNNPSTYTNVLSYSKNGNGVCVPNCAKQYSGKLDVYAPDGNGTCTACKAPYTFSSYFNNCVDSTCIGKENSGVLYNELDHSCSCGAGSTMISGKCTKDVICQTGFLRDPNTNTCTICDTNNGYVTYKSSCTDLYTLKAIMNSKFKNAINGIDVINQTSTTDNPPNTITITLNISGFMYATIMDSNNNYVVNNVVSGLDNNNTKGNQMSGNAIVNPIINASCLNVTDTNFGTMMDSININNNFQGTVTTVPLTMPPDNQPLKITLFLMGYNSASLNSHTFTLYPKISQPPAAAPAAPAQPADTGHQPVNVGPDGGGDHCRLALTTGPGCGVCEVGYVLNGNIPAYCKSIGGGGGGGGGCTIS